MVSISGTPTPRPRPRVDDRVPADHGRLPWPTTTTVAASATSVNEGDAGRPDRHGGTCRRDGLGHVLQRRDLARQRAARGWHGHPHRCRPPRRRRLRDGGPTPGSPASNASVSGPLAVTVIDVPDVATSTSLVVTPTLGTVGAANGLRARGVPRPRSRPRSRRPRRSRAPASTSQAPRRSARSRSRPVSLPCSQHQQHRCRCPELHCHLRWARASSLLHLGPGRPDLPQRGRPGHTWTSRP